MTWLTILRYGLPYVLCAIVAGYLTHKVDSASYESLQAEYSSYQTKVEADNAAGQKAAADALQAQIQTRLQTEANNGKVISQLQDERDAALAARDFSDRLLAAAAKAPASRCPVPTPTGGSAPDAAAQPSGSGQLAQLLRAAALETAQCFEHYTGLQVELQPQLRTSP